VARAGPRGDDVVAVMSGREYHSVIRPWVDALLEQDPTEDCIIWPFGRTSKGYGEFVDQPGGRTRAAHVVICERTHGPCPSGMEVSHSCNNGRGGCVNPAHMIWDTRTGNRRNAPNVVLTPEKAEAIRARYEAGGVSMRALGREYGVNHGTIRAIVTGETWKP